MKPRAFEKLALEYWAEIPDAYKRGVDGVRVEQDAKAHADLPDVYTMGECVTEAYPSDFGGPETIRSAVVLYHGSFAALAELDPAFDWEDELWETITHELRHHLESLADEDALEDVDYAADENFKRYEGDPFDPTFYRAGEPVEEPPQLRVAGAAFEVGAWRVEGDWFFQATYDAARPPAGRAALVWQGARHAFDVPALSADVAFLVLGPGFEPAPVERHHVDEVCVVLVRRTPAWRAALDALRGRAPGSEEIEVEVETTQDD